MGKMFYFCSSIENINLSNFYTENVTDMNEMFLDFGMSLFDKYRFI